MSQHIPTPQCVAGRLQQCCLYDVMCNGADLRGQRRDWNVPGTAHQSRSSSTRQLCAQELEFVLLTFLLIDSLGIKCAWTEPVPLASRVYTNPSCIRRRMHPLKSLQWFRKVGAWLRFTGAVLRAGVQGVSNGWPRWATVSGCCDRWCRRSPCRSRTWKQAAVTEG